MNFGGVTYVNHFDKRRYLTIVNIKEMNLMIANNQERLFSKKHDKIEVKKHVY